MAERKIIREALGQTDPVLDIMMADSARTCVVAAESASLFRDTDMRDLLLWRLLQSSTLDAGELIPLLQHLAQLSLAERMPFLGALSPAFTHPDAGLRRAGIAALAHATGRTALQRMVATMSDADETVRREAVETLRSSLAGNDWARWVHALFHPDPTVRQAAIDIDRVFPPPLSYKLYLLNDPVCGPLVLDHLRRQTIDGTALPLVFHLVQHHVITPGMARMLCADVQWHDWLAFLADLIPRTSEMIASLAEAMQPAWLTDFFQHYRPDRLDEILTLFWDDNSEEGNPTPHQQFFNRLWQAALDESIFFRQWLAFTLLGIAAQRKSWPPLAARLCAVCYPPYLTCAWVPIEVRRGALPALRDAGEKCTRLPPEEVKTIVLSEVCRPDPSVPLDLGLVGIVLHTLDGEPLGLLHEWYGGDALRTAFDVDRERGVRILSLPTISSWRRAAFVREYCLRLGTNRHHELAYLVQAVPADCLDFLDTLNGISACALFQQLLELEAVPGRPGFSENKVARLASRLAVPIAAGEVARFMRTWLACAYPEASALASAILTRLIHDHASRLVRPAIIGLERGLLQRFLDILPCCAGFPYDEEIALAEKLALSTDESIRSWAIARLRDHAAIVAARAAGEEETDTLAMPVLRLGACSALAAQLDPVTPEVSVCQALLASHDPPAEVVRQLSRFLSNTAEFELQLDVEMVKYWKGESRLPLLGHAWLYRWDSHRAILAGLLREDSPEELPRGGRGIGACLAWAVGLPSLPLARRLGEAIAAVLEHWRWHDREQLQRAWDDAFVEALTTAAPSGLVDLVAKICQHGDRYLTNSRSRNALEALRGRLVAVMPDIPEASRALFAPWIDASGLVGAPRKVKVAAPGPPIDSAISDEELARRVVEDDEVPAAQMLLERGVAGQGLLADALRTNPLSSWPATLAGALAAGARPALRDALRDLVRDPRSNPEFRFRVGTSLWPDGRDDVFADVLDAACLPSDTDWLTQDDLAWLCSWNSGEERALFLRLIRSQHPRAQGCAVEQLAASIEPEPRIREAFREFLDAGRDRMREWRVTAARWLYEHGERLEILPVLMGEAPEAEPKYPALLTGVPGKVVGNITASVLMAGQGEPAELAILAMLEHGRAFTGTWVMPDYRLGGLRPDRVDSLARVEALGQLLAGATSMAVRQRARRALRSGMGRSHKLRRVAETFAWGVRIGRQLTGKLFTLEMIAGEDLGYTRLRENKLFISPLPLLRGQQNGREVVRGLILHEYGHHLYHKGDEAETIWEKAHEEKLGRLLNLVSDEHLERNLRVKDEAFGNQLKQLGAFAFQHTAREVEVTRLLDVLRGKAFEVLTGMHLGVARRAGCVNVNSGRAMMQMERAGMSFARFVRALRMGLGNRHADPKVEQGLNLFRGKFRERTMPELMEVTRKLREIFGEETDLLETFNQDSAWLCDSDELVDASEGITNEELQSEIRRTLEGKLTTSRKSQPGDRPGGGRTYNINPEETFDHITNIVPRVHDKTRHAQYAERVARPAQQMRRFLQHLGLGVVPQRMRTQGKSFDRSRIRPLVLRGDPRVLIARETRYITDLFLGVLLDCSGSMSADKNIEKAKLFGTLLAEASRGLRGVTLRLWGFTDQTIYDCGDAARPAVHDLEPENANNDSAALWHASQVARASNRRAKVLVMISDGSPAGCSVASLTALVRRLTTRQKMLCAQVAVRPLDDICFPHYVLLHNDNLDECVRRFGAVMMRLVRQALRG